MARKRIFYVSAFGAIYKVKRKEYFDFLYATAHGVRCSIDDYGTMFAVLEANVTDLTQEQARYMLDLPPLNEDD